MGIDGAAHLRPPASKQQYPETTVPMAATGVIVVVPLIGAHSRQLSWDVIQEGGRLPPSPALLPAREFADRQTGACNQASASPKQMGSLRAGLRLMGAHYRCKQG